MQDGTMTAEVRSLQDAYKLINEQASQIDKLLSRIDNISIVCGYAQEVPLNWQNLPNELGRYMSFVVAPVAGFYFLTARGKLPSATEGWINIHNGRVGTDAACTTNNYLTIQLFAQKGDRVRFCRDDNIPSCYAVFLPVSVIC